MVFIEDDRTYGWLSSVAIEEHGQTGDRVADLVFIQTERVEIVDGGRYKATMQAKRCLDTGQWHSHVQAQEESGLSALKYCHWHGLPARTQFAAFSQSRASAERSMGVGLPASCL